MATTTKLNFYKWILFINFMLTKQTKPMKKVILLFIAMFAFTFANAQGAGKPEKVDAATRATKMTEKMSKVLTLTAEQKSKVQAINLESIKLMDLNQEKTGDKPNEFEAEKQRISKKWDTEMAAVITEAEVVKWKKHQADEKAKK